MNRLAIVLVFSLGLCSLASGQGGVITTVAGNGAIGFSGDGGRATSAELHQPFGVTVNPSGNLFIADYVNDRIREVSAAAPSGLPLAIPLPAAVNTVDVNPSTNQVYVGGNINNVVQNIVWIDGNTNSIVKSLGVGQGLHVNPATNKIYAADLYAGHILVYSGSDGSLLNTISAFGCPVEAVVDSSLNHIWGSGQCGGGNDPAFLIDGGTNTLISGYIGSGGVMGGAMAVNPATHALYMSVGGVEKEVNASTFAVTNAPFSASVVAFNLLAASMYGADSSGKNVVVIDYGAESVVATLPVSQTGAIAVNPTRNRVYAVDLSVSPQAIKVFGGGSNTLIGSIPLRSGDQTCCTMAVNSTSGTIYLPVTNSGSAFLLVIDDTLTSIPPVSTPVLTSLSPSTAIAGAGAFTVTASGSGFVSGSVVQWNGAALTTVFVSATQLTATVPASDVASVGVAEVNVNDNNGAATSNLLSFTIQASVGALSITSITPSSAIAGGAAFTLTVNGSGFSQFSSTLQGPVPGSVVQWNGSTLLTSYVSSTQVTAAVPTSDVASAGTAQVTVFNPLGGSSNALPFTISPIVYNSYTGCDGQSATGKLQLWITSLNGATGAVQINGVDSSEAPNTPFTWNWGDGATTQGFFPQSHTYSNIEQNYSLQVTAHENDGSTDCAQLSIIFNAQTTDQITSVTTAYAGPVIAQDTFIVIKGANLVPANTPASGAIWSTAPSFASGLMPTELGGVSVTVNNKPAFVYFYCSAATDPACPQDQLNILTPLDNTIGPVPVVVTSGAVSNPPFTVNMQAVAPSLLLYAPGGYIAATHANNTLVGPTSLYPGSSTPAKPGEPISLYAVGFGLPTTPLVNGSASQSGPLPVLPVCQVGGSTAVLSYAGMISPGLYQLNLTIPGTAANGDNAVSCTYDGSTTPSGDLINVQSGTPSPTQLTLISDVTSSQTGTPNGVCTVPPLVTSFQTAAPGVYLYFQVDGAVPGDVETTTFYRPDGVVYFTNTGTVTSVGHNGGLCFGDEIYIAGYPGASYPGVWTVSATWDNAAKPLFSLNFNLGSTPPAQQFTLTAASAGNGSGTISPPSPLGTSCGTNCWSYAAGTNVTLTATPNNGSTFAGWSGACSGTGSCAVTMNSSQSVTATFNLASSTGNGITISSLSSASPIPLTVLQIGTSGVNAANPVTLQFSNSSGFSATEQAVRVQSDGTVIAGVPLYIDPGTGQIGPGTVSLILTQGTLSSAATSIAIQDLPLLSTYGTQLGQISDAFLIFEALLHAERLNEFQAAQLLVGGSVNTLSAQTTMQDLLSASILARADIDSVMSNNGTVISWGSLADGTHLQFDSTQLDVMDRIIAVYLTQQFLSVGGASPSSSSLLMSPFSTREALSHPEFSVTSMANLLACLAKPPGPCFMQAQEAVQSSPNATDTSTGFLIGLKATLSNAGAEQEAGVAGLALGYAHFGAAMDSLTHATSDAAACLFCSSGDQEAILNELTGAGANIVSSIVATISQVPVMLAVVAEQQTVGIVSSGLQSIIKVAAAGSSGQITNADNADVSLGSPSPLSQLRPNLGYVTGTVENASSQGTAAPLSSLDLCCFGASQLGITGLAEFGGSYDLLVPIGVPGTNYAALTMSAADPLSGVSFGSEVVDLRGLNTGNPVQIPPVPTGSTPPTGGGTIPPGTYTGSFNASTTETVVYAQLGLNAGEAETCLYTGTMVGNGTAYFITGIPTLFAFNGTETWTLVSDSGFYDNVDFSETYTCSQTVTMTSFNNFDLSAGLTGLISGSGSTSGTGDQFSYSGSVVGSTIVGTYTETDGSGANGSAVNIFGLGSPGAVFQGKITMSLQSQ
jgi:uncharacterized protein (TIGR03437 family)